MNKVLIFLIALSCLVMGCASTKAPVKTPVNDSKITEQDIKDERDRMKALPPNGSYPSAPDTGIPSGSSQSPDVMSPTSPQMPGGTVEPHSVPRQPRRFIFRGNKGYEEPSSSASPAE